VNGSSVTTYYVYDGEKPIMEYNASGQSIGWNVYGKGIDELLQRGYLNGPAWSFYFAHQDHEGSVTHLTDPSGGIIEKYSYDAFGAPTIMAANGTGLSDSAKRNRFMFTGREWAQGTLGFYEYRARAYHPGIGRFMSEDPKGFDAGDYNLFRYCGNDPEDRTDPMGLVTDQTGQTYLSYPAKVMALEREHKPAFDHSKDDAEKAKATLVRTADVTPTGTHIPYHVRVYNLGNWNDRTIANHESSNLKAVTGKAGLTLPKGKSIVAGSNIDLYMRVDWYYDQKYRGTDVITRELNHVQDARNLESRYSSNYGTNLAGLQHFEDAVRGFNRQQKIRYDGAMGGDAPHDIISHPPIPTKVPELDPTTGPPP
jgi:RHS repeat-associated protein